MKTKTKTWTVHIYSVEYTCCVCVCVRIEDTSTVSWLWRHLGIKSLNVWMLCSLLLNLLFIYFLLLSPNVNWLFYLLLWPKFTRCENMKKAHRNDSKLYDLPYFCDGFLVYMVWLFLFLSLFQQITFQYDCYTLNTSIFAFVKLQLDNSQRTMRRRNILIELQI